MVDESKKLSKKDFMIKGSLIGAIITIPSLCAFVVSWLVLDNVMYAAIIGSVTHFIAMGFSLKISKKLLVKKS